MTNPAEAQLTEAIQLELARWLADAPGTTARDINRGQGAHGCCSDFVCDVYERLGGIDSAYELGLSEIGVDNFMDRDEDGECATFDQDLIKEHWPLVVPPEGMTWDDLSKMALTCGFSAGTHEWIHLNGRHYDSETPNGVDNFFDLPFFKRVIDSYHCEISPPSPGR